MRTKILAFIVFFSSVATAQTGGPFDLSHNVIASGGGRSAGTNGVRTFSVDGTIGQGFAGTESSSTSPQFTVRGGFWAFTGFTPTAASVSISGRVLTAQRRGISNARVTITDPDGETRSTMTNVLGFYRFDQVEVGSTYTVSAIMKRFQFTPQIVTVNDEITGLDLTGTPGVF
jgi:hypothetical protein